jgi:CMP-N-acetylneuraminic acid synthetase
MTTTAIIPARSGSKEIKRKNLRKVGSVSLLGRAVLSALASEAVEHVLVTTDVEEIRQEALRFGAEVPFLRPASLAGDHIPITDVLVHAINTFEEHIKKRVTVIVLTEPTNPFRTPEKIREAVEQYKSGKYKSVISVCPLERKPENIFVKGRDGLHRYIEKPQKEFVCRQDMQHLCRLSSLVYVVGREDFLKNKKLIIAPTGYIDTTHIEAINIDTEIDLEFANLIAEKNNI